MTQNLQLKADTRTSILDLVSEISDVPRHDIDIDEDLLTSGLVDSIGIVRLIADLEVALKVSVPAPDLVPENFRTVRVMTAYLDRLRSS